MSLDKEAIIKLEEIEKRMHSLNKKILNNTENINDVDTSVTNLNNEIENDISSIDNSLIELNNKFLNLQEIVENTETFNFFEIQNFEHGKKGFGGVSFDRIHFLCKKACLVRLKVTVSTHLYSTGSTYAANLYMMLNSLSTSTAVLSGTVTFSGNKDYTFNFEYSFYPTQEHNYLNFRLTSSTTNPDLANLEIKSINIEASGRNIMFLNRNNNFKLYISKDYYYLTKNKAEGGYYLKAPASNVNLNSTFSLIPNLIPAGVSSYTNRYYPYNYTYIPKIIFNSSTSKYEIDHSETAFTFCINSNNLVTSGFTNPPSGTLLTSWSPRGWVYSLSHPGDNGLIFRYLGFAYTANLTGNALPGISISKDTITNSYLSVNGVSRTGNWDLTLLYLQRIGRIIQIDLL